MCELSGEESPRLLNTFSNLCVVGVYTLHMLCIAALVDCAQVGSAEASFQDLVTLHRRTLQTKHGCLVTASAL